jgi:hypothetical protein
MVAGEASELRGLARPLGQTLVTAPSGIFLGRKERIDLTGGLRALGPLEEKPLSGRREASSSLPKD